MPTRTDTEISADHATPRRNRRALHCLAMLLIAAATACGASDAPTEPGPPDPPPAPTVRLKDIVIPRLPSPYYHFTYDGAGRVDSVSFASELTRYQVAYLADGRIKELRNNIVVNHDRIVYAYDATGHVVGVRYVDSSGATYTIVTYEYVGDRLTSVERSRRDGNGFLIDKTMALTYDADGNLFELTEHRPAIAGVQDDATYVDRFEQYDKGLNVDGFDLLHDDFFDHLVLLPGVQLQKGNPRRQTRTGDGQNFIVDYTYTYSANGDRPVTKSGVLTYTSGPDTGRKFDLRSEYSYY